MESNIPPPRRKRPESTLAQNFAADLDSMFGLTPEVEGLSNVVNVKKDNITTSTIELQELEARLRAMEERLAKASRTSSPARAPPSIPRDQEQTLGASAPSTQRTSPLAHRPTYPADRPPTAPSRQPPMPPDNRNMPGQFPPHMQHHNMSNEYVMVEPEQDRYR